MLKKNLLATCLLGALYVAGAVGATACGGNSTSKRLGAEGEDAGGESSGEVQTGANSDDTLGEPDGGAPTEQPTDAEPEPVSDVTDEVTSDDGGAPDTSEPPPSNEAPQAIDAELSTNEDTPLVFAFTGVDAEADELVYEVLSGPAHGVLVVDEESISYTPNADYVGEDSIEYQVSDGDLTDSGLITITVLPVNDAPVAEADEYLVTEGQAMFSSSGVLDNDSDVDGDELVVVTEPVSAPEFGSLTLNADGTFTYEPTGESGETDSFAYEVCDPEGACSRGEVTLLITLVNDEPTALDDEYNVNRGGALSVDAPGVLANDGDVDDDELSAVLETPPAAGTVVLNEDGSFSYTHDGSAGDVDTFTYSVCDPDEACATATVTLNVLDGGEANNAPLAVPDTYMVNQGAILIGTPSVLANDSDPEGDITLSPDPLVTTSNGSLTLNPNGTFVYTHDGSETAGDTFQYEICDAASLCSVGVVTIVVLDINQAPTVLDDEASVDEGGVVVANVLDNDVDPEGDLLSVTLLSDVTNGTLSLGENGEFNYAHDGTETTEDEFEYEACDPDGACAQATVTLTVNLINEAPVANDDEYAGSEGTTFTTLFVPLTGNDLDADGDELVVTTTPTTPPATGTLTLNPDGTFSFDPAAGENLVFWDYEACDPSGACDEARATLTLANLPPNAIMDTAISCFGNAITIPVMNNDSDPGMDPIDVTQVVMQPSVGFATLNPNNTIFWSNFIVGAAQVAPTSTSFTYELCDNEGACSVGNVLITFDYSKGCVPPVPPER